MYDCQFLRTMLMIHQSKRFPDYTKGDVGKKKKNPKDFCTPVVTLMWRFSLSGDTSTV